MEAGKYLAVWLSDEAASVFLGLPRRTTVRRWCALGFLKEESAVGMWVEIDVVQERSGRKVVATWKVQPKLCLIRWSFITHVQVWGEPIPAKKEIGFIKTSQGAA